MSARVGKCCKVLRLVLSREPANGLGIVTAIRFNFAKRKIGGPGIAVRFRKAKPGEPQEHADATFAWVEFCPFCGTPTRFANSPAKRKANR